MKKTIQAILEDVIKRISPTQEEINAIYSSIKEFEAKLKPSLKRYGAKIFIGGSLAKQTIIKKGKTYDIDLFIVFPYKFKEKSNKLSDLLERALKKRKIKYVMLKGSRNYFQVRFKNLILELIPIIAIKKASEAANITDISPLHVFYIVGKIKKNKKLADEIKLAKAFCYAANCYGAESYIRGFSGYAIEILVCHYGSFFGFIKNASKWKLLPKFKNKIIIDPANHYKNKLKIFEEMNKAKLHSPIILVDPVQKERNVTAALSFETFERFIAAAKKFLEHPSENYFFKEKIDVVKLKKEAKKAKAKLVVLEALSSKKKADVAGAKLKKFYEFFYFSLKKNGFKILKGEFEFDEKTMIANFYFILKEPEKYYVVKGPPLNVAEKYILAFKKKWPNFFIEKNRLFAKAKRKIYNVTQLLALIPKTQLKEMGIKKINLVNQ